MKRTLLALLILGFGFSSCKKEPQPLTKEQIQQEVDSMTRARIKQSDEQAARDLNDRIKIEVKAKVDSIVNAKLKQARDTDKKPNAQNQPRKMNNLRGI